MTPYARFRAVSVFLTSTILISALLAAAPFLAPWVAALTGSASGLAMLAGGGLTVLTVWAVLALLVMPGVLRLPVLRRLVLGRYYIEGTWIEALRGGKSGPRLAVLSIKPGRDGFCLSATTLLRTGEVERSWRMAFGAFDGQVLSFKYDTTLSSGAHEGASGIGEIQFETTDGLPKRFAGGRNGLDGERIATEGVRLTKWRERRRLKRMETRGEIVDTYWSYFFESGLPKLDRSRESPVIKGGEKDDKWRQTDTTPTADKIRKVSEVTAPGRA